MAEDKYRAASLAFYEEDIEEIGRIAEHFLSLSKAKCVMLVDKDGHLIIKRGQTESVDSDTISALVAGSFAATREIARLIGEDEFSVLFHQGLKDSIQLSLVGDRALLVVVFDDSTTIGMVRLFADQTVKKLAKILIRIEGRHLESEEKRDESDEAESTTKEQLNDFFKE